MYNVYSRCLKYYPLNFYFNFQISQHCPSLPKIEHSQTIPDSRVRTDLGRTLDIKLKMRPRNNGIFDVIFRGTS